jgi:hypothetical protein
MYFIGAAHPHKVDAQRLLERLVSERERLVTDAEVFQEILHRYVAIDRRDAIQAAYDLLLAIVDEVLTVGRDVVERAVGEKHALLATVPGANLASESAGLRHRSGTLNWPQDRQRRRRPWKLVLHGRNRMSHSASPAPRDSRSSSRRLKEDYVLRSPRRAPLDLLREVLHDDDARGRGRAVLVAGQDHEATAVVRNGLPATGGICTQNVRPRE